MFVTVETTDLVRASRLVPGLETGLDDTVDGHKLKVDFHSVGLITMRHRDNGLLDGVDEVSESNTKVSMS